MLSATAFPQRASLQRLSALGSSEIGQGLGSSTRQPHPRLRVYWRPPPTEISACLFSSVLQAASPLVWAGGSRGFVGAGGLIAVDRQRAERASHHRRTVGQTHLPPLPYVQDTTGQSSTMQALTGITSRLDRVQSFLDDKIADTPAADLNDDDAAQRSGGRGRRRRRLAAAGADAVKDELLGAVQDDDDDDDDLETDALKAENARLKREVRCLDADLEAAERDGNNYRNDARDARKKLAALKRAQDDDDDSTKKAERSLKRDLADARPAPPHPRSPKRRAAAES